MTLAQAIYILKTHNEWRRGATIPMSDPTDLGIAIDLIINTYKEKENNDNTNKP